MTASRWVRCFALGILAASAGLARARGSDDVTGRVINADGQAVVGATVSNHWQFEVGNPKITTYKAVVTDAEGKFSLEMNFYYGRSQAILALDPAERTGGVLLITPAAAATKTPVEIKLSPLVRVHGKVESAGTNHPLKMATVMVMLADNSTRIADCFSFQHAQLKREEKPELPPPAFDIRLPAGDYVLQCFEPTQAPNHTGVAYKLPVKADQPNLDHEFKTIKLPLTALAKQSDQNAPELRIKAARGVPNDVKLADFRGKWVILEFWTTTCGPCIARGLPAMMELVDDNPASRDKFVVLAIHGPGADDFADLDRKLVPIVRDVWNGRELPFPILLDDDGKTFAAYGIQAIPTTIVINPEGKVTVGGEEEMRATFPEPPIAVLVERALDRPIPTQLASGAGTSYKLSIAFEELTNPLGFPIKPDPVAWQAAGVTAETRVPLSLIGPISLRTALKLVLEPLGLAAMPDPDGLIVTSASRTAPQPAPTPAGITWQTRSAERLQRRLGEPVTLRFSAKPLADLLDQISQEISEPILLDPVERKAGTIDPTTQVTINQENTPLGAGLRAILAPLGLEAVVRDEVIIVQQRR